MISYNPFWVTLKHSVETTYSLINKHKLSSSTINRLRKNKPISTVTLNDLCRILHCRVEDINIYIEDTDDQTL